MTRRLLHRHGVIFASYVDGLLTEGAVLTGAVWELVRATAGGGKEPRASVIVDDTVVASLSFPTAGSCSSGACLLTRDC